MMTPTERILAALEDHNRDPKRNGKGWSARCPAHEDRRPSLSVSEGDDGRALLHCHAGCDVANILAAIGLTKADLFNQKFGESAGVGCTLGQYAEATDLPPKFLEELGLKTINYLGNKAVRMPYRDQHGEEIAVRFRLALTGRRLLRVE